MNKIVRFLLVLAVFAAMVAFAGSKTVWANLTAQPAASVPDHQAISSAASNVSAPGTVAAPGCDGANVRGADNKSVCGEAVVTGNGGETHLFAYKKNKIDGFISHVVSIDLQSGGGTICFSAPKGGVVYFFDVNADKWVPLATTVEGGLACAVVSKSGDYVFGK